MADADASLDVDLIPQLFTRLAREIVTGARTLDEILDRYDLSREYYDTQVAPNAYFQKLMEEYTKEWQSIGSTHKRLAFAAAVALEEKLPVLAQRMGDHKVGLSDAVNAAKLFKDLAGIAAPAPVQNPGQPGDKFSIHIDFGHRVVNLEAKREEGSTPVVEEKLLEAPSVATKDRPV
jgi:hypothetical protein